MRHGPPFLLLAVWALSAASCVVYVKPDDDTPPPPPPSPQEIDAAYTDSGGYDSQAPVDVHVFYDELAPYGRWVDQPSYGRVWYPSGMAAGWQPYSNGRWVESEYGWTWVSEERFGWATYHYGRWYQDSALGWVWVPGRDWGPAWVSFDEGGGYVGWAPLPPTIGYRAGVGLLLNGVDLAVAITPRAYVFVPERSFLEPRIGRYFAPRERNVTIIRNTVNITNITVVNNRIVNRGIPVSRIEQATGHPVQRFQIADAPAGAGRGTTVEGNQVRLYRPRTATATGAPAATRPAPRPTTAPTNTRDADSMTPGERRRQEEAQRNATADEQRKARIADDQAKAADQANRKREDADQQRKARIAADEAKSADQTQRRNAADEQRKARIADDQAKAAARGQAQKDAAAEKDKARLARIEADKAKQQEKEKAKQEAHDKTQKEKDKDKDKDKPRDDQKPPGRR